MPSHQRPNPFVRATAWIRDRWEGLWSGVRMVLSLTAPEGEEDESYESGAGWPAPAPTSSLESAEHPVPQPARREPTPEQPLVYLPAPPQDVLRNIAHNVMDMLGRDVSAYDVFERLAPHMVELKKRHQQLKNLERRSVSNTAETQMDAGLLAAAARRGESPEELAQRAERVKADMLARAKRASDPEPTGVGAIPPITEDMPDPRQAVAEPEPVVVDVPEAVDGLVPVYSVPLPSEAFLTAAAMSAPVAVANEAMALRTPVAPVDEEPDRPWTVEDTGPETVESLSAICDVDDELAQAGTEVSA